jgi:hypothetical protein
MQPFTSGANGAQLATRPFDFWRVIRTLVQGAVTAFGFGVAIAILCVPLVLIGLLWTLIVGE